MANTSRRTIDRSGRMFLPMNMQGSTGKEYFITVPKIAILCAIGLWLYIYFGYGSNLPFSVTGWIITLIPNIFIIQKIIRKLVLEEDYFYDIYTLTNDLKEVSPDIYWRIASIRHTPDGDILVFSDMKIACILRLERDTIVGKAEDGSEKHYDAWSDFYRELHERKFKCIQMNLMEPSGKDPRLNTLGMTASQAENRNVKYALELEMGHLKRISNAMLSEFEYFMIYSESIAKMDDMIPDLLDCSYTLLQGAYSSAKVMTEREIYSMPKSMFNVTFFDGIQAQMNVYRNENKKIPSIMRVSGIKFKDSGYREITEKEDAVLSKLSSLVESNQLKYGEWTVSEALDGSISKLNNFNKKVSTQRQVNTDNNTDTKSEGVEEKQVKKGLFAKNKKEKVQKDKNKKTNKKDNNTNDISNKTFGDEDEDLFD